MDKDLASEVADGLSRSPDEPQSNHEHAMAAFSSCGYEVRFAIVNPADLGIPASRPRIHYQGICKAKFPFINTKVAMDALLEEWNRLTTAVNFNHTLADYLQPMDDLPTEPEVADPALSPMPVKRQRVCKWETVHEEFKSLKNVDPTRMREIMREYDNSGNPFWRQLPRREKDLIIFMDLLRRPIPEGSEEVMDTSQSLERLNVMADRVPCITPACRLWLRKRQRWVTTEERLALQGLNMRVYGSELAQSDESLKAKLAGNAFSFHCFMVGFSAALATIECNWFG
eukprot:Skav210620  [mRNA]  locus=scaffold234:404814:406844:- [translate_table: standard]